MERCLGLLPGHFHLMFFPIRRYFFVLVFCVFGAFLNCLHAEELFLGIEKSRIGRIVDLGYNFDERMDSEIEALRRDFPNSPMPGFLDLGKSYWYGFYEGWSTAYDVGFESKAKAAITAAKDYRKAHKGDPDAEFVVATSELALVMYYIDQKRWWNAFWKFRSSVNLMRSLLVEHPEYHDAKLALGTAYCYAVNTPTYLKPLAFIANFKGDMELGLEYLEEAKLGGFLSKADAGFHLGLMSTREASREEFRALANDYPGNIYFQLKVARGDIDRESAMKRVKKLQDSPRLLEFPRLRVRVYSSLCWDALRLGNYEEALRLGSFVEGICDEHNRQFAHAIKLAKARALRGLERTDEAVVVLAGISSEYKSVYRVSQKLIEEWQKSE